jgi:hypothetical protein
MLNKLTMSAVGAAILVTVASASMTLLRDRGPMTNQMIGIEPVPFYFNFEDIFRQSTCARFRVDLADVARVDRPE